MKTAVGEDMKHTPMKFAKARTRHFRRFRGSKKQDYEKGYVRPNMAGSTDDVAGANRVHEKLLERLGKGETC